MSDPPADPAQGTSDEQKCPVCKHVIEEGEIVVYRHGDLIHVDCWEDRAHRLFLR